MSRSDTSHKAPGTEFWARRPGNRQGGMLGRLTKRDTHRRERLQGKREMRTGVECAAAMLWWSLNGRHETEVE